MTVQELIRELSKHHPDREVVLHLDFGDLVVHRIGAVSAGWWQPFADGRRGEMAFDWFDGSEPCVSVDVDQ